jgi:hypothetical protein
VGDRIVVFAVCADGLEATTSTSASDAGAFVEQSVLCPMGTLAVGGGAMFTDAEGGARDGMLMASMPVGSSFAGWLAAGSTQYATTGGRGPSNRIQAQAICVPGGN